MRSSDSLRCRKSGLTLDEEQCITFTGANAEVLSTRLLETISNDSQIK